jgi:hypothetical protein
MNRKVMTCLVAALLVGVGALAGAVGQPPVPIEERVRGAERVVVATVAGTSARMERNRFGDELIVTYAQLAIEEALKGGAEPAVLAVEGGTLDGLTLRVSDLPVIENGERAVFFLTRGAAGAMVPHLRGQGILKLDSNDTVRGSSLTVGEIRRLARGASPAVR